MGREWLAISLIVGCLTTMTGVVYWRAATHERPDTSLPAKSSHDVRLPTKCAKHYNSGTDAWIQCMGVGYK